MTADPPVIGYGLSQTRTTDGPAGVDERLARIRPQVALLPAAPVPPTRAERRRITAAKRHVARKAMPPEVRLGEDEYCRPLVGLSHTDEQGWLAQAKVAFGTVSAPFVDAELARLLSALRSRRSTLPLETEVNAALAMIAGLKPQSEAEALLAVQMSLVHVASVEMLTRLGRIDPFLAPEQAMVAGTLASKLMRTFAGHMEVLAKSRRPAVQTVRVERVNVEAGAQAVVGAVSHPRPLPQTGDQPHEADDHRTREPPHGTALRREDPGGHTLPASVGPGSEPLSAARRRTRKRRPDG